MTFFFQYIISKRNARKVTKPLKKRRRSSLDPPPASAWQTLQEEEDEDGRAEQEEQLIEQENANPCLLLELPTCILADILSRLPFKLVCICRCVCKTWRYVTYSPDFNSLRIDRADAEIFLRSDSAVHFSRTLHFIDIEKICALKPPRGLHERREIEVDMRVCLPGQESEEREFGFSDVMKKKGKYDIVNSCNGLLCLRKSSTIHRGKNPCGVCNPFTGEFVAIPKPEKKESIMRWSIVSGFGCGSRSSEYKVVRLVYRDSTFNPFDRMTEVYTLGADSWKSVRDAPWDTIQESSATFLNGAVHWLSESNEGLHSILCFDFEVEQFRVLPFPPHFCEKRSGDLRSSQMSMGVLGRFLFVSGVTFMHRFEVWVMKDYGKGESWTKEFSFNIFSGTVCRPIKSLENGDFVLLRDKMSLVVYNPVDRLARKFKIRDAQSVVFEAISYVPSFGSLKDIAGGDKLTVQNFKSRWTVSDLREGAAEAISLVEEGDEGMDWPLRLIA